MDMNKDEVKQNNSTLTDANVLIDKHHRYDHYASPIQSNAFDSNYQYQDGTKIVQKQLKTLPEDSTGSNSGVNQIKNSMSETQLYNLNSIIDEEVKSNSQMDVQTKGNFQKSQPDFTQEDLFNNQISQIVPSFAADDLEQILNLDTAIDQRFAYQEQIYNRIIEKWSKDLYGALIFIETGSGKSYLAIKLIKHIYGQSPLLQILSEEEMRMKFQRKQERNNEIDSILRNNQQLNLTKKVFFVVPTQNLVEQQANVIDKYTDKIVEKVIGGKNKKLYSPQNWQMFLHSADVFVIIGKKLVDLFKHGLISFDQIELLIFDEAHHTCQDHMYNLIMSDYFSQQVRHFIHVINLIVI